MRTSMQTSLVNEKKGMVYVPGEILMIVAEGLVATSAKHASNEA